MKEVNILFTSIGNKVYLTKYFRRAYERLGFSGKMVATGIDPLTPGIYTADAHYLVPRISDSDFLPKILEICRNEKIHVLQPTSDDDAEFFAIHKKEVEDSGILVMANSVETAMACRDKWNFFEKMKELGISTVPTWGEISDEIEFPCIYKPRRGKAAIGVKEVSSMEELKKMDLKDMVIQKKIVGTEYTIDYFGDLSGKPISIVPRIRMLVSEGESKVGRTHAEPSVIEICKKLGTSLGLIGQNTIQVFLNSSGVYMLENNMRFGGGSPLGMEAGLKSPEFILRMAAGEEIVPDFNFKDNLLMIRYSDNVFLDYDQIAHL